jgi:hypothetical protein
MGDGRRGKKGAKVSQPSRATDKIGAVAGVSDRTVDTKVQCHCTKGQWQHTRLRR